MARIFSHFSRQRLRVFTQYSLGISATSFLGFYLWTRKCHLEPFGPENDVLFKHPLLKQINPNDKPLSYDSMVRAVPFSKIKSSLLENARSGGNELMEAFCAGVWGGYGYFVQRNVMLLTKTQSNNEDIWTKKDLLNNTYEPGTYITNHFLVLDKSPTSLTLRGCVSPRQSPPIPQPVDNIIELVVDVDDERRVVTLKLKCITFDGTEMASQEPDPFGGVGGWLHQQYSKLLVEAGADNCTI